MFSFTSARSLYGSLTNNNSSTNLTLGDTLVNEGIRMVLGGTEWPFLEKQFSISTVASQQSYDLPGDYDKTISVTLTVGTVQYRPKEVTSQHDWEFVNATTGITSNVPEFFYVLAGKMYFWPTPASAISNGITVTYKKLQRDLNVADYTTGSIVSITNGAKAIVGTGTTWTAQMIGRYLRITLSDTANTGDGFWYEIAAVPTSTTITLSRPYIGSSIAAGTAPYAIGQVALVPEKYQRVPIYYAAAQYWIKEGDPRGQKYLDIYERELAQMKIEYGNKTTDPVVDDGSRIEMVNPNLAIFAS